jgi:hypothetical protein
VGWLTGYPYRKRFVVAAGVGASTDFQYPVKVYAGVGIDGSETLSDMAGSKVYVGDRCTASFSNLTFTSSDGTTELSHWQQTVTAGVSAVYWVKTPDATANQTLYIYYGAGVSKSNQVNTFVDVISGVVGAWNMEEANAIDTVVDYSGNGNDGTPTDTAIINSPFVGKKARNLNGLSSFIQCGDLPLTVGYSYSCWVKMDAANAGIKFVFTNYNAVNGFGYFINDVNTDLRFYDGAGYTGLLTAEDLRDGNWHFVCVSLTALAIGATITLYVDGVFIDSALTTSVPTISIGDFFIGQFGGGNFYKGGISNLCVYDATVSLGQDVSLASGYPDVSLDAGKVLVRKYASTTNPAHSSWGGEEIYEPAGVYGGGRASPDPLGPPAPRPTVSNMFMELIRDWLQAKTKHAS